MTATFMPEYARALLSTLSFSNQRPDLLAQLGHEDWCLLLNLVDRMQLTLLLGNLGRPYLPAWVRVRIDSDSHNNAIRFARLRTELDEIGRTLSSHAIPFTVLKGFTHSSHFCFRPELRVQGDIDIWSPPNLVAQARNALASIGYRPVGKSKGRHLDPMIRDVSWKWSGDYFAPDLPIPVDLHYQLWDEDMEHIAGPNEAEIWNRRCLALATNREVVWQLDLMDALAFASLHTLMHLLHGDLRLQRVWELGFFLQKHRNSHSFWADWGNLYSPEQRLLQVIPLALSHTWFGVALPPSICVEVHKLPGDIRGWLDRYGWSPVESLFSPNKHELLLNLRLLKSIKSRARVFTRRVFPVYGAFKEQPSKGRRQDGKSGLLQNLWLFWCRAMYHFGRLPSVCWQTLEWWWCCRKFGRNVPTTASPRGVGLSSDPCDLESS